MEVFELCLFVICCLLIEFFICCLEVDIWFFVFVFVGVDFLYVGVGGFKYYFIFEVKGLVVFC